MEMINRTINGGYPVKLGAPLVDALEQDLNRFKGAVEKWVGADTQPHLYEALQSLEAPLVMLRDYFTTPGASTMTPEDLQIVVGFLYERIRELRAIASDIDNVDTWKSSLDGVINPVAVEKHIA